MGRSVEGDRTRFSDDAGAIQNRYIAEPGAFQQFEQARQVVIGNPQQVEQGATVQMGQSHVFQGLTQHVGQTQQVTYAAPQQVLVSSQQPLTYTSGSVVYGSPQIVSGAAQFVTPQSHSLFDRIDANHDGSISKEEFAAAMAGATHA